MAAAIDVAAMISVDAVSLEISEEAIRKHLLSDEAVVKAQTPDIQAAISTKNMRGWMAKQEKTIRKQIKRELTKKHGIAATDSEDSDEDEDADDKDGTTVDGYTLVESPKAARRRRANGDPIIDDTELRANATKRAAEEVDAAKSQENARKTQSIEEELQQDDERL